jgi:hypothetical protein
MPVFILLKEKIMWSKTYSQKVTGLDAEQLWKVWTDVNQWHTWQDDIEYAKLDGEFSAGQSILFKPKGSSEIKIELTRVEPNQRFVDLTRFPLAKMYDTHEIIEHGNQLEVKTTVSLQGILAPLWRKLVAEDIANSLDIQTERLIARAKNA